VSRKKRDFRALLGSAPLVGVALALSPSQAWVAVVDACSIFLVSFLIFAWYYEDARERAFRRGRLQDFGVAAVALVGLPVYLFRSRGPARGAIHTGVAVLLYALLLVLVTVGGALGFVLRALVGMPMPVMG
jgi:hypothetical protein